jgi:DNA-binding transcriptional regulator YdaS (Cro superfamily)
MNPVELRSICDSLNPGGQSKLARMLGVSPRTVRRWVAGKYEIPTAIDLAIQQALNAELSVKETPAWDAEVNRRPGSFGSGAITF